MKQQKLFSWMWFLVAVFVALPAKAQVVQDAIAPKSYNSHLITKIPRISEIALPVQPKAWHIQQSERAMMDKSERATAATDYTIQVSVMFLGGIAAGILSGKLAQATNYTLMFIVSAVVSLLSVFAIAKTYDRG